MKRLLILLLISVFSLPAIAEPPAGYPFLAFDEAMQQATQQGKPIFVYFGRYGCGYCDKTNAETFTDATVKQQFTEHYVLAYVDSESGKRLRLPTGERITERDLGTRYDAFVTPVFSFITVDGEVLARLVGVQRVVDFMDAHKQVQAKLGGKGT